jgi:hypothetical protein
MDSIYLPINELDFSLGELLFLNWVQHRARSNSTVPLLVAGLLNPPKFAIDCTVFGDDVRGFAAIHAGLPRRFY